MNDGDSAYNIRHSQRFWRTTIPAIMQGYLSDLIQLVAFARKIASREISRLVKRLGLPERPICTSHY
eukprot:5235391-Heterocapsa_arctica.AAC.1